MDDMELSAGEFSDHSQILRRKRSKRKRPSKSPPVDCAIAVTSSYSSGGNYSSNQYSPATSTDVSVANEEELEEMANCLILLAESLNSKEFDHHHHRHHDSEKVISRRVNDTASAGKPSDSSPYECKTCNRTFPSFQALGGHRASHTKPNKVVPVSLPPQKVGTKALILPKLITEKVTEATEAKVNNESQLPPHSFLIESGNSTRASSKVHECSTCGAEFATGQALGGHMRRHRITPAPINKTTAAMSPSSPLSPLTTGTNSGDQTETSEENGGGRGREMVLLDLNLPVPEYDQEAHMFQFMPSTQAHQFPGYG